LVPVEDRFVPAEDRLLLAKDRFAVIARFVVSAKSVHGGKVGSWHLYKSS
jgi:hypothetical protein